MDVTTCPPADAEIGELLRFALSYNAYERIAVDVPHLGDLVRPVIHAVDVRAPVPDWAGVDLLRAALFYAERRVHHSGPGDDWERVFRVLVAQIAGLVGSIDLPDDRHVVWPRRQDSNAIATVPSDPAAPRRLWNWRGTRHPRNEDAAS